VLYERELHPSSFELGDLSPSTYRTLSVESASVPSRSFRQTHFKAGAGVENNRCLRLDLLPVSTPLAVAIIANLVVWEVKRVGFQWPS